MPPINANSCESMQGNALSSTVAKVLRGREKNCLLSDKAHLASLVSVGEGFIIISSNNALIRFL